MKLSEVFSVPPDVLGYLEWTTGLLFVNFAYRDFQSIDSSLDPVPLEAVPLQRRQLLQTLTHETYHFAQIVTTGFLYRFACNALSSISEILRPPLDSERIEHLLASPPRISGDYAALISELDVHSGNHLTNRAVIESATMLFEHRSHLPRLNHRSYLELLRSEIPTRASEYRIAYEIAAAELGDSAFEAMLPLGFLALCFDCPREAFLEALVILTQRGTPAHWNVDVVQRLARTLSQSHQPIGSSIERLVGGDSHPIYSPVVLTLNDAADEFSPIEMMIRPDMATVESYLPLVRPTIFRDGVMHVPSAFADRYGGQSASAVVGSLAVLGALAMRIGQEGRSVGRFRTFG